MGSSRGKIGPHQEKAYSAKPNSSPAWKNKNHLRSYLQITPASFQNLSHFLESAADQLKFDALDLYLIQPEADQPVCCYLMGFHHPSGFKEQTHTWKGLVWRVIAKKDLVTLPDLWLERASLQRAQQFHREGFVSYHAAPLAADGILIGVLETYFRNQFQPNPSWFKLLRGVAKESAKLILEP